MLKYIRMITFEDDLTSKIREYRLYDEDLDIECRYLVALADIANHKVDQKDEFRQFVTDRLISLYLERLRRELSLLKGAERWKKETVLRTI